jgi:hypothetical protein
MTGIALNSEYDLKLENGFMVLEEITAQNQALLLLANKGELKEYPLAGVGVEDMILSHNFEMIRGEIINQLEADGQAVKSVKVTTSGIALDAQYK